MSAETAPTTTTFSYQSAGRIPYRITKVTSVRPSRFASNSERTIDLDAIIKRQAFGPQCTI